MSNVDKGGKFVQVMLIFNAKTQEFKIIRVDWNLFVIVF